MKTESVLEKVLASGELAVTGECGPPRGALPDVVKEKAALLKGYVDAVNVTDNQTAMVRMSSFAASVFLRQMDLHPMPILFPVRFLFSLCQILSENFAGAAAPAGSPILG